MAAGVILGNLSAIFLVSLGFSTDRTTTGITYQA